jgi:hypothetical protein
MQWRKHFWINLRAVASNEAWYFVASSLIVLELIGRILASIENLSAKNSKSAVTLAIDGLIEIMRNNGFATSSTVLPCCLFNDHGTAGNVGGRI